LLVGSTINQRGGPIRAEEAKLGVLDMDTKELLWEATPVEDAVHYYDMHRGPNGRIFATVTGMRGADPQ